MPDDPNLRSLALKLAAESKYDFQRKRFEQLITTVWS
jgi:hypothetical protein